jgi:hypothetical protein
VRAREHSRSPPVNRAASPVYGGRGGGRH